LIAQGELIGSLNLGSDRPAAFTAEAVAVAHEVANQLAIAIRHARLFEEVHAGRERLLALSRRLVGAQEDERRRIARELHDGTGQALTAALMNLQVLRKGRVEVAANSLIDDTLNIIERTLQRVRNLSLELRPSLLDDLGLVAALRWYVDRQARRAGFEGHLVVEPACIRAPAVVETTCFRVVQEALTNVARHARASRVRVELREREGELSLVINDNGVGFDVDQARRDARAGTSLGLLSMEERVVLLDGVLQIESEPGRGTVLRARFAPIGAATSTSNSTGRDPIDAGS
jgi:signal transduction histidine kinase